MTYRVNLGLAVLVLCISSGIGGAEEGDSEFDSFLESYTAVWNAHDGKALSALFTEDADLIAGSLPRVDGREAIGAWWEAYFSRLDEGRRGEFELVSLRHIAPDVRLANVGSKTFGVNEHGESLETRLARGTWVVVKRNGIWQIAAMRALPAAGEQRFRPGEDR